MEAVESNPGQTVSDTRFRTLFHPASARARRLSSGRMPDWNQQVIDEFRANAGRVGGNFEGRTLLLLHHRGAKTGAERVNPVAYQRLSEDSVAVFASKGGAPTNPDWYHNLVANPEVTVELGTETYPARRGSRRARSETRSGNARSRTGPGSPSTRRRRRGSERSRWSSSTEPETSSADYSGIASVL